MKVSELIALLAKAPADAEVMTAYDSMVCVDVVNGTDVWAGDGADWRIPGPAVFICASSADAHGNHGLTCMAPRETCEKCGVTLTEEDGRAMGYICTKCYYGR